MPKDKIRHNIIKIYIFRFFRDFLLIAPILIPFYKSLQLSNTQIFTIQAIFSLSLFIFEIPSGYFSDRLGRRLTLIIGAFCLPIGLSFYALGNTFGAFACGEAILGLGFAMCSGTESALIYDTLLKLKQTSVYHKIEGVAEFITRLGATAAAVLGGVLAQIFFRLPFYINIFTGVIMFITALSLREAGQRRISKEHPLKDMFNIIKYSLKHQEILSIIIFYSIMTASGLISIWGYFLFLQKHGFPISGNGIWFAVFQLASGCGAVISHRVSAWLGRRNSYLLLLLLPLIFTALAVSDRLWMIYLVFPNAFVWGFSLPFFLQEVNKLITSDIRATVLSTGSMAGRILFVILSPLFGLLSDQISLNAAFIGLSLVFILCFATGFQKLRKLLPNKL
jgi:MFS family permease